MGSSRIRVALLVVVAFVAVTAVAGGGVLALAAATGAGGGVLVPSEAYLAGTPFGSYLVPGLLLAVVIGGLHAVALVALIRRARWAPFLAATAAFALLIWIFVQLLVIPFNPLQAVYEVAGLVELGLLLLALGLLDVRR